jgi:hypothetical protein
MAKRKLITDPRIGIGDKYPDVSLLGQSYDRTQSTVRFDKTHFVVLDRFISNSERDTLLAEIRAVITGDTSHDEPA